MFFFFFLRSLMQRFPVCVQFALFMGSFSRFLTTWWTKYVCAVLYTNPRDSRCTVVHYMQESLTWISCSSTFRGTLCAVERFHSSQLFLKPRVQIPPPCAQGFFQSLGCRTSNQNFGLSCCALFAASEAARANQHPLLLMFL